MNGGGGNILQNESTSKTEPCRRGTRETWCKFQVSTNSCFANRATNTGSIVTKARTVNATEAFGALHAVLQIIRSTCTTKPAGRVAVKHSCYKVRELTGHTLYLKCSHPGENKTIGCPLEHGAHIFRLLHGCQKSLEA